MALLIKSNGTSCKVFPENGKSFKLEEFRKILGCFYIDILDLANGQILVIDDEGKLRDDHEVNMPGHSPVPSGTDEL